MSDFKSLYEKERKLSDERLTKITKLEKDLEMLKKENQILTKMRKDILKGELVNGSLKTNGYWESYVDKTAPYMNLPAPVREHVENLVAARNEPCHDVNVRTDAE